MNGGSLSRGMTKPWPMPAAAPVASPATIPSGIGSCQLVMTTPVTTADSDMTVPIDRSIPPAMITNVTPRASTPLTAVASRMPTILSNCRKLGEAIENTTTIAISTPNASSVCTALDPRLRRAARGVLGSRSSWGVGGSMFVFRGGAPRRVGHDLLLARSAGQLRRDPPLAHHEDAMAHAQHLGQLRRDHQDRLSLPGHLVHQVVDLALGANIDPTSRLVEQQDLGVGREPLRDHDLLLVAARQVTRTVVQRRRPDLQRVGVAARHRMGRGGVDRTEPAHTAPQRRERDVGLDSHAEREPVSLPVLRHIAD